jgi:hypothetical protein
MGTVTYYGLRPSSYVTPLTIPQLLTHGSPNSSNQSIHRASSKMLRLDVGLNAR